MPGLKIAGFSALWLLLEGGLFLYFSGKLDPANGIKSHKAIRTKTANGDSVGYMTRLESVKLGGIMVKNVAATIAPNLSGADALLGMSFLNRMDVRLHKGTMTIKPVDLP